MELFQGEEPAHDFLSLRAGGSPPFQRRLHSNQQGSRAEGRSSGSSADQEPNSPRSKHSATEQRRRTKINDRLDVLRELLPNCNQKRDKASFLLEVIEYIRHLQERCHKYESAVPDKNHVDAKSMPWDKVYYRSRWMNAQNISQVQGGGLSTTGENMNKEQHSSKSITAAPAPLFSTQSVRETSTTASSSHNITESSMPSNQPPWLSMSTMNQNCDASNRTLNKHEPPSHHNNSQSLSSAYSQGLLHKLKEALQKAGVDPSQANISVEFNMDRQARANAHTHDSSKANEGKEPIHIAKRLRCD
ncbi:hypothetical protein ACQ4PT_006058 [Festuca glaucescens]